MVGVTLRIVVVVYGRGLGMKEKGEMGNWEKKKGLGAEAFLDVC